MASLEALRGKGAFVIDPLHERVHRAEAMEEACAAEVDATRAQFVDAMIKADMVMKTRHYAPCPRCWPSEGGGGPRGTGDRSPDAASGGR